MHWALINGSPRGKRGNTVILLGHLARGLAETGHSTEVVHLSLPRGQATAKEQFRRAERIVLANVARRRLATPRPGLPLRKSA